MLGWVNQLGALYFICLFILTIFSVLLFYVKQLNIDKAGNNR